MPESSEILAGLESIANDARALAIVVHFASFVAIAGVLAGVRPSRRALALALVLPCVSVGGLAFLHRNPFNGTLFAALSLALTVVGLRLPRDAITRAPSWALALGLATMVYGLVYPHFVRVDSPFAYLYSAPTGLVPCPTLALVLGSSLAAGGLGSRSWSVLLASAGAFYGVFGVFRLGVLLDVGLVVGAVGLFGLVFTMPRERASSPSPRS